jgi:hypothetical protein
MILGKDFSRKGNQSKNVISHEQCNVYRLHSHKPSHKTTFMETRLLLAFSRILILSDANTFQYS